MINRIEQKRRPLLEKEAKYLKLLWEALKYGLGLHMVYSILFLDHEMTLDLITAFSPFEFVNKYEECMLREGLQPVISATSGEGVVDYKKMVEQLTAVVKSLEDRKQNKLEFKDLKEMFNKK